MSIFLDKIEFQTKSKKSAPALSKTVVSLDSWGSFFLSPVRYLCNGRSVVCIHKSRKGNLLGKYTNAKQPDRTGIAGLLKGIASILLFIPGGLVGYLLKRAALACETGDDLRAYYKKFDERFRKNNIVEKPSRAPSKSMKLSQA